MSCFITAFKISRHLTTYKIWFASASNQNHLRERSPSTILNSFNLCQHSWILCLGKPVCWEEKCIFSSSGSHWTCNMPLPYHNVLLWFFRCLIWGSGRNFDILYSSRSKIISHQPLDRKINWQFSYCRTFIWCNKEKNPKISHYHLPFNKNKHEYYINDRWSNLFVFASSEGLQVTLEWWGKRIRLSFC